MLEIEQIFYSLERVCDKWVPYFPVYDTWFSRFRGKSPRILEIGVYKGGSAELWQKYFGEGTLITGIDIDPSTKQFENQNFKVYIGDAGSTDFWFEFTEKHPDTAFDIIIDDGGHHMMQQIITLEQNWVLLKHDGIYLIEDTHTSYWDHWPRAGLKNPDSFVEYTKNMIDVLTEEHLFKGPDGEVFAPKKTVDEHLLIRYKDEIKGMHFYNSMVVIEKGIPPKFERVFSKPVDRPVQMQQDQMRISLGNPGETFTYKTS